MISVGDALQLVLGETRPKGKETVETLDALGRVLAEDIQSSIDSPPFDKVLMDGYAVVSADPWPEKPLDVIEVVTAGETPQQTVQKGKATRIMTGAPLPSGADAVVPVEETTEVGPKRVQIDRSAVPRRLNVLDQACCLKKGETVLKQGTRITPAGMGILAEIGRASIEVYRPVTAAILATGNELVEIDEPISAGQIRNSNGPMLVGLVAASHAQVRSLGIARDREEDLKKKILAGLQHDVLILSGGVSAGDLDLVPSALKECGVEEVFHKVQIKPGKPLWFGRRGDTLVFGLPGNPVSSFVCYHCFVRPALARLAGDIHGETAYWVTKSIIDDFQPKGYRTLYYPAKYVGGDGVERLDWKGSADLRTIADAECLVELPAGNVFCDGDRVRVLTWPT